jgi:hypothetical protein
VTQCPSLERQPVRLGTEGDPACAARAGAKRRAFLVTGGRQGYAKHVGLTVGNSGSRSVHRGRLLPSAAAGPPQPVPAEEFR